MYKVKRIKADLYHIIKGISVYYKISNSAEAYRFCEKLNKTN